MRMKLNFTFYKILGVLVVIFLLLNPETIPLALFIDAIGIDLFMLLIGSQILSFGSANFRNLMRTSASFIQGFASHTWLRPQRHTVAQNPAALLFAIPSGAALVQLLCITTLADITLRTCL